MEGTTLQYLHVRSVQSEPLQSILTMVLPSFTLNFETGLQSIPARSQRLLKIAYSGFDPATPEFRVFWVLLIIFPPCGEIYPHQILLRDCCIFSRSPLFPTES